MKAKIYIGSILSLLLVTSCVKDLDVVPKDPETILTGNLHDDPAYIKQLLAKVYASFIINGQGSNGGADISSADADFFTTTRALWNLQELPTDEAICAWGDVGIADLNTQTWTTSNPFLTALFQRLGLSITYVNDFLFTIKDDNGDNIPRYRAEARFLRALAYYWHMDLFGNPPFTTEEDGVGKIFPAQLDKDFQKGRTKIFNYIVTELKAIESDLGEPGFSYPNADKGACWMLLARLYLNAEVYTGSEKWDSCLFYSDKVINSGAYSLASNYRQNFSADNGGDVNPEMIFGWSQDGQFTQGWVGSTFLIQSSSDATYLRSETIHGLTSNTNWNGNRATKQFLNVLVDTLKIFGGQQVVWDSVAFFNNSPLPFDSAYYKATLTNDSRVYVRVKKSVNIPSASATGDYGVGVYKFTAKTSDGEFPASFNAGYANTDFPVFRYADALLMKAEAAYRKGDNGTALTFVNMIRERAFGDVSGHILGSELDEDFILDERCREFYYEGQRRTDLIRFGKFTGGKYVWAWKGNVKDGASTSAHRDVYPIPTDEIDSNPNIVQNPGY